MENQGWIKIHRKILDTSFSSKPTIAWLFIVLLIKANHKENKFMFNKEEIIIKPGQLLTGRVELSKITGLTVMQVRYGLECLKVTNVLTIKTTNKFSVITILKYEQYQNINQQSNQPVTNKQPTSNQPVTTNNNVKNVNNIENEEKSIVKIAYPNLQSLTDITLQEIADKYKVPLSFVKSKLDDMTNWLSAKGKKYKNYKAALSNWVKSDALKIIQQQSRNVKNYKPTEIQV